MSPLLPSERGHALYALAVELCHRLGVPVSSIRVWSLGVWFDGTSWRYTTLHDLSLDRSYLLIGEEYLTHQKARKLGGRKLPGGGYRVPVSLPSSR